MSQVIAASVSAIPAYLLSRRWVWKREGLIPSVPRCCRFGPWRSFGLVFRRVGHRRGGRGSPIRPPVLMATSLAAYGVVWIAMYVVLDKIMWAHAGRCRRRRFIELTW